MPDAIKSLGLPVETRDLILALVVILLGAIGTYLLLPHSHGRRKPKSVHLAGAVLVALSVLIFAATWHPPGPFLTRFFFYAFGISAVAGGVLMITSSNPVYSALWFAAVVLASSGLFLLSGAQFLAAGTVIVYAGAIIVTFLFVIMLAQIEGLAAYDRSARSPRAATFCSFLLLWGLAYAVLAARVPPPDFLKDPTIDRNESRLVRSSRLLGYYQVPLDSPRGQVLENANRETSLLPEIRSGGAPPAHVAGLGGTLYTDHLIAAELAGVLLFVALVGALVIAAPRPPIRPGQRVDAVTPNQGPLT